ncbi:GFA family protein [Acinetobacter baumannii]
MRQSLFFHQSELKISGELKYFETLGSSGRPIKRAFARLVVLNFLALPELVPEMISIRAGTLDDPSLYHPKAEVFVSQTYAWDMLNPNLKHFGKNDREEQEIRLN